jgi:hypothetical protein
MIAQRRKKFCMLGTNCVDFLSLLFYDKEDGENYEGVFRYFNTPVLFLRFHIFLLYLIFYILE